MTCILWERAAWIYFLLTSERIVTQTCDRNVLFSNHQALWILPFIIHSRSLSLHMWRLKVDIVGLPLRYYLSEPKSLTVPGAVSAHPGAGMIGTCYWAGLCLYLHMGAGDLNPGARPAQQAFCPLSLSPVLAFCFKKYDDGYLAMLLQERASLKTKRFVCLILTIVFLLLFGSPC